MICREHCCLWKSHIFLRGPPILSVKLLLGGSSGSAADNVRIFEGTGPVSQEM